MRFDGDQAPVQSVPRERPGRVRRRTGWLPLAAVRPDYELTAVNGTRLRTPGVTRSRPVGAICSVSYRAELRPSSREVISHLLNPQAAVVARTRITGGQPVAAFEAAGEQAATWSMESATAAAATVLGFDVREDGAGALVEAVRHDTSAVGVGELIVSVDGATVSTASQLRAALAGQDSVQLAVVPAGRSAAQPRVLARHGDGSWGLRVVTAARRLSHGVTATFDLPQDLRGPSLGLACALSVVDAYTGGRLASSGTVVATGTVDLAGRIGSVGAVEFKARAVRTHAHVRRFVVPAEAPEDVEIARRIAGSRVEVVAVTTLAEAVELLGGRGWRSGNIVPRSADRRPSTVLHHP